MRAAALAAAALLSSACGRCTSPTFAVRSAAARTPAPAPPAPAAPRVRVLHLADFGEHTRQQAAVAAAVAAAHRRQPFDLALFPGDDIYPCGPDVAVPGAAACAFAPDGNTVAPGFASPPDPSFGRHEAPLAPLAAAPAVPIYLALGNHDVLACRGDPAGAPRLKACLAVAHASPLWRMPGRHYVLDRGPARFIVVDSNLVKADYGGFSLEDEVAFVAASATAAACDPAGGGRSCFLVGHHPPVTAGSHRTDATPEYLARMERLLAAGGGRVRAWLGGHDHDLQHLRTPAGLDVLVSGQGQHGRSGEEFERVSVPGSVLEFGATRWGYGILEVGADGWRYRFEGDDGAPLYCCAAGRTGPCAPTACP